MASPCKSQQCSKERRGFRQELDSWRHKLVHCVGFESILEGLVGPGLVKDTVFEDCEPDGVSDWSFDENCLFCCLRREKVKEHLVGLNEPVSEAGEKALRQEQAKIIRLEKQAEEFLHAIFYEKAHPRVLDSNIPLVARKIMQRMIRQFAAEYTSKSSSTQDPNHPNSTKNQSQPKASQLQTSPTAATSRNPVLSKLLMANQESPLDLTVKKSQLESKEQDGVLDLSTKKPLSVGCSSLGPSSGASPLGNGDKSPLTGVPEQETHTLEKFMVKLCTNHQKLVHLPETPGMEEKLLPAPENMNLPTCSMCELQYSDEKEKGGVVSEELINVCSDSHSSTSVSSKHFKENNMEASLNGTFSDGEKGIRTIKEESSGISVSNTDKPMALSSQGCFAVSNSPLNIHQFSEIFEVPSAAHRPCIEVKKCAEDEDQIQEQTPVTCFNDVRTANGKTDDCLENDLASQKKSLKQLSEESRDSELVICSTQKADKENTLQCNSTLQQDLEKYEHPASSNTERLSTRRRPKDDNHLHHNSKRQFDNSKHSWPSLRKTANRRSRGKSAPGTIKTIRNCKRASGVRINDFDNQCDVVYISQPITECQFENQRPIISSRKTARKSTRGYFFNGECCELSTVRTLFRSSRKGEILNCSKFLKETLVLPKQSLSNTFPLMQFAAVASPDNSALKVTPINVFLQGSSCNNEKSGISTAVDEPKLPFEPCDSSLPHLREAAPGPLVVTFSHTEKTEEDTSLMFQCTAVTLPVNVKYEDATLVKSIASVTDEIQICTEPLNERITDVRNIETPSKILKAKNYVESGIVGSKDGLKDEINCNPGSIGHIIDNAEGPEISTPFLSLDGSLENEHKDFESVLSLSSLEKQGSDHIPNSDFENINCLPLAECHPLITTENTNENVDLIPAFPSKSSHDEHPLDSKFSLSLPDTPEDLIDTRLAYSPEGSYGEDSVDFRLALSLENTPTKDCEDSRDGFSAQDFDREEVGEIRQSLSSEDLNEKSEYQMISSLDNPSDFKGVSSFDMTNKEDALDCMETTFTCDSYGKDFIDPGHASPSNVRVKEMFDSLPPSFVGTDSTSGGFRCQSLSKEDTRENLKNSTLVPASEFSDRKLTICCNPASPSNVITGEEAINIGHVAPSNSARINECVSNVSIVETALRKDVKSPRPYNVSKRSVVNADGSNKTESKWSFNEGKQCEKLMDVPNPAKIRKIGTSRAKKIWDTRKKSEPLKKCKVRKTILKKNTKKKKKSKNIILKSDRRLRSQYLQSAADSNGFASSTDLQVPGLKIKLFRRPGTKPFQRMVHIHRAISVNFPVDCFNRTLLEKMKNANLDESENSADECPVSTRQFCKTSKGNSILDSETDFSDSEHFLTFNNSPANALQIMVDMNTDERIVSEPINVPTNCNEKMKRMPSHTNGKHLLDLKSRTGILQSQSESSSTSLHVRSGKKTIPSRTFMKQKKDFLRNHNLRLKSALEKSTKKDLAVEHTKAISAMVDKRACSGKEKVFRENPLPLNEAPQGTNQRQLINWFAEEENQERIADFNAKYMNVQKGWILLEKDLQIMHRVKNKSDKLKEIWKTKKRVRKIRNPPESQKLSPVQVLFMKAFKLSDICKWFLETTETKSLVIVKKVSTRLPGDFPMPMMPIQRYPSMFPPSAQAERLKKHLKKFASASPVKNNHRTQKFWAKFRNPIEDDDSGISKSLSSNSDSDVLDSRNANSPQSFKTPASARILRKYSNMRGKLRSQNSLLIGDNGDTKEEAEGCKSVSINPSMSPHSALQDTKNDTSGDHAETTIKDKIRKKRSLEISKPDDKPNKKKKTLNISCRMKDSFSSSFKGRPMVRKATDNIEQNHSHASVPSTRNQATLVCISKRSCKTSLIEKKAKEICKKPDQKETQFLLKENKSKPRAKTASIELLPNTPKIEATKASSCKMKKKHEKEACSGTTQTRSMKRILSNSLFKKKTKKKANPEPEVCIKQRLRVAK
ncbi:ligand-dependent corepressor isoform X2 [Ambystoma mexicanum]|uniref:ligand-dependent corepressor isoform X2 n=1 Tax=Ambystoma mexicanum TaxID=8296 RepID=UPI0037E7C7A8